MEIETRVRCRRGLLTTLLVFGVGMPAATVPAGAQDWAGWSFYWENDTWVFTGDSDDAFTNGLRLVLQRHPDHDLPLTDWFEDSWPLNRARDNYSSSSVVVGQNMFTPREITDYVPDPTDRPYAGLAYIGARYDVTEARNPARSFQSQMQHSFEFDVGVLGSGAGGHPIQSGVHSTITTHRLPKGWPYQIDNTLALSGLYMWRWKLGWPVFDVVPHLGVLAGTVQTYPFGGLNVRVGWNMASFPAALGRNTAARTLSRPSWEAGLVAGVEGRYMLQNSPVEGRLLDEGNPGVDPRRDMGDFRLGAFFRLVDWRLSYTYVQRSPEVLGTGPSGELSDSYGSIAIAYEPRRPNDEVSAALEDFFDEVIPSVFDGFVLEAGIGIDLHEDDGETAEVWETHGMHGSFGRKLGWGLDDFDLLFQIDGVGREFGPSPTAGGDHFDRLLINKGFALRYRFPWDLAGQTHIRVGYGWSTMEYEATPASPGPRTCPAGSSEQVGGEPGDPREKTFCVTRASGSGPSAAIGYTYQRWPFTKVFGLNADLAWNRSETDVSRDFVGLTFGFRWLPGAD